MAEKKYLDSGGLTTLVSNIKSKVETITNQLDNKKATKDELASAESRITAAEKDIDAAEVLLQSISNKLGGIAPGAEVNQNAFSNVKVGSTTVAADAKQDTLELVAGDNITISADTATDKISISAKDTTYSAATTSADGLMSATDKTNLNSVVSKLGGISSGAEVNQNAFSNVKVGSTTVVADAKQDTLELAAGTNITIDADTVNDKISISTTAEVNQNAFSNVKVGSTTVAADAKQDTLELVAGANITIDADAANDKISISAKDTTYNEATTSAAGLMSATDKTNLNSTVSKLSGIASGAEVNQNAFSNVKVEMGENSTTIAADTKTDTLTLVAGGNITIETDAANDKISISAKDTTYSAATTSAAGLMSATDKTNLNNVVNKLSGIASGAEVNQNAFSNVKVGSTTVEADAKQDTLELVAGSNVTISADAATDKISISAKDTTYGEATTSAAGLMSATDKTNLNSVVSKLSGISSGAEVNQNSFSNVKVGSTTVVADAKQDTLELVAGTNITIDADTANDKISISTTAEVNQNAFSNVKVGSTTVAADAKQDTLELAAGTNITIDVDAATDKISISAKDTTYSAATTSTAGLMSATDKTNLNNVVSKLGGISSGAEVNQNAFSNVKVGSTTVAADAKQDTLELAAGSNITIDVDAATDKISISAKDTTYNEATTSAAGLMSATDKTNLNNVVNKLSGISSGAEVNQNAFAKVKVGSTTVEADAKQDTVELVQGSAIVIGADVTNDKISISHEEEGPTSGYTSGNTTTSISGSGGSGTIKIPQLTVDKYGHVTAAVDENVTITMPTIPTIPTVPNSFSNIKVGSNTVVADAKQDTVELVQGHAIVIGADVTNDKISISHEEEGPTSGYTSGNTTTSISGSGGSGTIKIPQLTVDKYGHVTAAADESVTITMPTAADLGLSSALKYHGTTTTAISDGSTTNPIVIGGSNHTATQGCVVAYDKKEFVWTGSAWEELGNEGNYKVVQTAVSSPSASGSTTAFIDTISQDTNGKITVTKKNVSFPNSITGNAGTATKLATARTIGLGTGVTGTATSFDGSGNITIPVTGIKEAYLSWGGQNYNGGYGPIDAAMVPQLGANRLAFLNPDAVLVEYSTNGGSSWSTYSASKEQKVQLFNGLGGAARGASLIIGGASQTGVDKTKHMVRITITTEGQVYTTLNKFVIHVSTNGSNGCYCTITARTQANVKSNTNTWTTFANNISVSGWSGYNVINTDGITTYGYQDYQYGQVRFTFGISTHSQTYGGLAILSIMGFGGYGWTAPSNLAKEGTIYSCDWQQNVTFPAKVTATTFSGSLDASNLTGTVAKARLGAHSHAYTPAGTIGNATATGTVGNATAGGSVSSTFTGTAHNHGFTGTVHKHTFTGTAHNHTFTGTAAASGGPSGTTSVYSITGVGSLPSCTLPSTTVSYSNGELSITHNAGSFSAGSLPSRSEVTVASSNHTHSVTATGTIANTTAGGSLNEVAATGTIGNTTAGGSVSSTFTGTAHNHGFTGTAHNHSFTGTAGNATTIS